MVEHFNRIDHELAVQVARGIGVPEPPRQGTNHGQSSAALSIEKTTRRMAKTRKLAIIAADGCDLNSLQAIQKELEAEGVDCKVVAKFAGKLSGMDGKEIEVDKMFVTTASVLFDAVLVPGGAKAVESLAREGDALHFIYESYRHCKPVAAFGDGVKLIERMHLPDIQLARQGTGIVADKGVVTSLDGDAKSFGKEVVKALAQHRHWEREMKDMVPA